MRHVKILEAPQPLKIEDPISKTNPIEFVSLAHIGLLHIELNQEKEDYRIIALLHNGKWSISRIENNKLSANFQGNPLWPVKALGNYPNLKEYFGLSYNHSKDNCIIPLTETINARIEKLHKAVGIPSERIFKLRKIGKQEASEKNFTNNSYVNEFIDKRTIPMAPIMDRDSLHDWSYHFFTLLFPEYLENVRLCNKTIVDNIPKITVDTNYLWNYYGHDLNEHGNIVGKKHRETVSFSEAIYRQIAISLDVATAKIIQLIQMDLNGIIDRCKNELIPIEEYLSGNISKSINRILWNDNFTINKKAFLKSRNLNNNLDPLGYIYNNLEILDQAAKRLLSEEADLIVYRKKEFIKVLHKLKKKQKF